LRLQDQQRVVFVDLRGCGHSTRGLPSDAYTPTAATHDLVALLSQISVEPVDVLGFSYGGLIAQRLALMAPLQVRRLVVASSSVLPLPPDVFVGWRERDERIEMQEPFEAPAVWDDESTRRDAVASAPSNIWRLELLPEYVSRLDQIRFSSDWAASWVAGALPPARVEHAAERLAELAKPVLLLHGRQDMTFPASLIGPTLDLMPTAVPAVIDEAGHMAHIDQPEAWLTALRHFLHSSTATAQCGA
jgi:pimeloyl-ACP methyl ester carboxylesterase